MSVKKRSFLSGLLYLSLVVLGPIGFLLLPEQFNVENINVFTSNHLVLLGAWILVDILIIIVEVFLSIYLYKLLKKYHIKLAFGAFVARLLVVGIMVINAVFLLIVLLSQGDNASVYVPLHGVMVYVWEIFFSVHIVLLGLIVYRFIKSRWHYLGIALLLGSIGYILDSIINLANINNGLLESIAMVFLVFITIGEIGMAIGLLMNKIVEEK